MEVMLACSIKILTYMFPTLFIQRYRQFSSRTVPNTFGTKSTTSSKASFTTYRRLRQTFASPSMCYDTIIAVTMLPASYLTVTKNDTLTSIVFRTACTRTILPCKTFCTTTATVLINATCPIVLKTQTTSYKIYFFLLSSQAVLQQTAYEKRSFNLNVPKFFHNCLISIFVPYHIQWKQYFFLRQFYYLHSYFFNLSFRY